MTTEFKNDNGLISNVSRSTAFDESSLTLEPIVNICSEEFIESLAPYCQPRQCFDNALKVSQIHKCEYILGAVYFQDLGFATEHAWNADESGSFDVTNALFWEDTDDAIYFECIRFSHHAALDIFDECGGLHRSVLTRQGYLKRTKSGTAL